MEKWKGVPITVLQKGIKTFCLCLAKRGTHKKKLRPYNAKGKEGGLRLRGGETNHIEAIGRTENI